MAPKPLVGTVAAVVLAPLLLAAFAAPAAGALSIDAPGWSVVWPGQANSSAADLFVPGDVTGDGVDDVVLFYPPKYDVEPWPAFEFRNSFDLFGGSDSGLAASPTSHSNGSDIGFYRDPLSMRTPQGWDFNGDGHADVALGHWSFSAVPEDQSSQLDIWFGSARGFAPVGDCAKRVGGTLGDGYSSASWRPVGDLNGDGVDDLVAVRPPGWNQDGTVSSTHALYVAHGSPTCANETLRTTLTLESEENGTLAALGSADFNGDGFEDLVTDETTYSPSGATGHRIRVYPGTSGNLSRPGPSIVLVGTGQLHFFVGPDLNADGFGDLVVGAGGSALVGGEHFDLATYRGSGAGLFGSSPQGVQLYGEGYASAAASLGDFNGDGSPDLALERSNITGDVDRIRVDVYLGRAGSFAGPPDWRSTAQVSGVGGDSFFGTSSAIDASGDVDGDGLADVVVLAGANPFGGSIFDGQNTSGTGQSAILIFYGRQIVQFLSGVGPVGFDQGVAHPTYEYGFDVTAKAASSSAFDRVSVATPAGNFTYLPASASFAFEPNTTLGTQDFARMHASSLASFDNRTTTWDIRFRFEFTWDFPLEDPVPYRLVATGPSVPPTAPPAPAGAFRVEKDIEFGGALQVSNASSGAALTSGQWVAGGAALRATGLTAHFEGAPSAAVPPSAFSWLGGDDGGGSWVQGPGAASLDLVFTADAASDPTEHIAVTLAGLPNPDIAAPTVSFPYRVDADAPSFGAALPSNDSWVASHEVTVAVQVLDPLSGADRARAEFQVSTAGPEAFGSWLPASFEGSDLANSTAAGNSTFLDGDLNFFRFRVWDAVGNGPALSGAFQVRVDTLHVVFADPSPAPDRWQTSPSVPAAVTVRDLGASGVSTSSVAYRASTGGLFGYGSWVPVPGLPAGAELRAQVSVGTAEGDQNFVQWRAEDVVGTGLTVSANYRVRADRTAPVFGEATPAPADRRTSPAIEVNVTVSEGGPDDRARSGLNLSSVEYSFWPPGGNESEWTREGLAMFIAPDGNWTASVDLELAPGPENRLRIRAFDMAGNGPALTPSVTYHLNRAPTVALTTNATNHTVFLGSNITLAANVADADGDEVAFTWYEGALQVGANNSATLDLGLPLGSWTFRVAARDGFGGATYVDITVNVVREPPPPPPPPPPSLPRPAGGDTLPLLLVVLVGGAATVFLVRRARRPRRGAPGAPP